jgi:hypothetical protein
VHDHVPVDACAHGRCTLPQTSAAACVDPPTVPSTQFPHAGQPFPEPPYATPRPRRTNKHISRRQTQRQISDVYGGDGCDFTRRGIVSTTTATSTLPSMSLATLSPPAAADTPFAQYFCWCWTGSPEYRRMMADVHSVTVGAMYAIGCAIRRR